MSSHSRIEEDDLLEKTRVELYHIKKAYLKQKKEMLLLVKKMREMHREL